METALSSKESLHFCFLLAGGSWSRFRPVKRSFSSPLWLVCDWGSGVKDGVWMSDWSEHPWRWNFSASPGDAQMQKHLWDRTNMDIFMPIATSWTLYWPKVGLLLHFAVFSRPKVVKYKCVWVISDLKVWAKANGRHTWYVSSGVCVPPPPPSTAAICPPTRVRPPPHHCQIYFRCIVSQQII